MRRLLTYALLACVLVPATVVASEPGQGAARASATLQGIFDAANLSAARGDYANAIHGYSELVDAGVRDENVYFNFATALAESGDYPRAILYFEKALTIRPNDTEAVDNLQAAEKELEDQRVEREGEAMIHRSRAIGDAAYRRISENTLAYTLLASNFLFFVALAWFWASERRSRALYALLIGAGAILALSALGLAVKAGVFRDGPRAVVLDDRLELREGPDPRARVRGQARGGDRGEIVGTADDDFVKLRVVGGSEGWAPIASVGQIDPEITTD